MRPSDPSDSPPDEGGARGDGSAQSLVASIDDAGDVFVVIGDSMTIGHATHAVADVGLLADLEPIHARVSLVETFHGGLGWALVMEPGVAAPEVDGAFRDDERKPVALVDGVEVRFGQGAQFTVRRSDDSSASLMLELGRGTEIGGARRVLLMAFGEAGRARIGPRRRRHVPVGGLLHDVALVAWPAGDSRPVQLEVRCAGGARRAGSPPDGALSVSVDLPLTGRLDLALGAAPDRLPPFGIALRPPAR